MPYDLCHERKVVPQVTEMKDEDESVLTYASYLRWTFVDDSTEVKLQDDEAPQKQTDDDDGAELWKKMKKMNVAGKKKKKH